MGRITRKMAAEVAEALHVDEDAVLNMQEDITHQDVKERLLQQGDRAPLGSLEPNSTDNHAQPDEEVHELRKSTRTRAGGKKSAKDNLAASLTTNSELADTPLSDEHNLLPEDNVPISGVRNVIAAEDLTRKTAQVEIAHLPVDDTNTAKHHNQAVNDLTGAQLVEPKSLVDGIGQTREELDQEYFSSAAIAAPEIRMGEFGPERDTTSALNLNAPASPLPTAVPNVVAHLRSETPGKRSTSNKENIEPQDVRTPQPSTYDVLEDAAVTAATPPSAPAADPISALDALDEAVESVKNDIPDVQSSPEKPERTSESSERKAAKKAAPVVRATKASQARISLAQNPEAASKAPALGRPRPSTTLARSNSVRQSSAGTVQPGVKHSPPAVVAKREVIIPHSKPRPVSLSFPTPPQPMKSTKAPTQSTFQLPGEAVAAKLKAAKEARMQKELDEAAGQKKAFKARPVPASLSRAPSVRHTNASKARESLMSGKDLLASTTVAPGAVAAHKRAQSVATTLNPRASMPHSALSTSRLGASTAPSISNPTASRPSTTTTQVKRTSLAPAPSSAPFNPTASTQRPATVTAKGKEVFNRPAAAKAAAEKAKTDKEAAAKKARAEAAERGRAASREWAEKQKRIAAAANKKKEEVVAVEGGVSA